MKLSNNAIRILLIITVLATLIQMVMLINRDQYDFSLVLVAIGGICTSAVFYLSLKSNND